MNASYLHPWRVYSLEDPEYYRVKNRDYEKEIDFNKEKTIVAEYRRIVGYFLISQEYKQYTLSKL